MPYEASLGRDGASSVDRTVPPAAALPDGELHVVGGPTLLFTGELSALDPVPSADVDICLDEAGSEVDGPEVGPGEVHDAPVPHAGPALPRGGGMQGAPALSDGPVVPRGDEAGGDRSGKLVSPVSRSVFL